MARTTVGEPQYRALLVLLLSGPAAVAQTSPAAFEFEAASVKVSATPAARLAVDFRRGQVTLRNFPIRLLIVTAYRIRAEAVHGLPAWSDSPRYDITAKSGAASFDDQLRMLQSLLVSRFQLKVHREDRVAPALALTVTKPGRLKLAATQETGQPACKGAKALPGQMRNVCHATMTDIAEYLQHWSPSSVDLPVADQTNLKGVFDFELTWAISGAAHSDDLSPATAPNILEALQAQLGLKLERKRLSLPLLVVDRIARPVAD